MNIFCDDLEYEEIDFTVYYNEDDEPCELDELEEHELINILSNLERQIKMLPEHYNVEIWKEYQKRCKQLLD